MKNSRKYLSAKNPSETERDVTGVEAVGGAVPAAESGTTGNPDSFSTYVPTGATSGRYIVNRNNGKIHVSSCSVLPEEEKRIYFDSFKDVLDAGYSDTCGKCHPR